MLACHQRPAHRLGSVFIALVLALAMVVASQGATIAAGQKEADSLEQCRDDSAPLQDRLASCNRIISDPEAIDEVRAEAYLNRGIVKDLSGESAAAIEDLSAAIKLNPEYPAPHFYRGVARDHAGQTELSVADFSEALRLDPEAIDALIYRGAAYLALGEHDKAIADFTLALALEPGDAAVLAARGEAFENKGDRERAIEDYRSALKLEPDNEDAAEGLSRLGAKR